MGKNQARADTDPRLVRIAEAIVEGWSIDWAWEEEAYPEGKEALARLRLLQSVANAGRPGDEDSGRQPDGLGTWGRLTIRAKLGEGVFGEVYRAYDSLLDREVALKLARTIDPGHTERFVSEARRLARVRHPNVLVVHGADVSEGRMGIWTDLLPGTTLAQHLASKGPLEPREAALIGVELCRALAAVHDEGIVHRDLKAANVMREPGGRVVLMDFGSGGELQAEGAAPNGHVYGTPLLMAPEQIRGDAVGQQADIYSLGVLLYNAVTGEFPIVAASLAELMERHIKAEVVPIQARRPELPSDFVQIIDRATHPEPTLRFQTADAMELELIAYCESCSPGKTDSTATSQARAEHARTAKGRSSNPEAHRSYLMARHFMDRGTGEAMAKAIEYLKQAVDLDPRFALAWAELSRAYAEKAHFGWTPETASWKEVGRKWFGEARRAAERALALDPNLAEAHVRLGIVQLRYELDWRSAETSFMRARETAPRDVTVLRGLGLVARSVGDLEKAVRLVHEALELDPLSPASYQHLGIALECLDRLGEAEAAFRRSLDLAPQKVISHAYLSVTLARRGRLDEALAEASLEPDDVYRLWATAIITMAADSRESDAALRRLITHYDDGATYQIAEVYGARGEAEPAFEWLEKACGVLDGSLMELKTSPRLRKLHGNPRYKALLRKVGLED